MFFFFNKIPIAYKKKNVLDYVHEIIIIIFWGVGCKNYSCTQFWTHDITICPFFWEEEMPFELELAWLCPWHTPM